MSDLMAIDTLAYAKALGQAGIERRVADAHTEVLTEHVLAELATKSNLERAIEGSEQRLAVRIADAKAEIIKMGIRCSRPADARYSRRGRPADPLLK
jgi:hypothetical protein